MDITRSWSVLLFFYQRFTNHFSELSCNNAQGEVRMKVTMDGSSVMRNMGTAHGWTNNNDGTFAKEWQVGDFDLADSTEYYAESGYLVLSKTVKAACTEHTINDVTVCTETGHTLTFKCRYPLVDQNLANDLTVTGNDFADAASGIGKLHFTLSVDKESWHHSHF